MDNKRGYNRFIDKNVTISLLDKKTVVKTTSVNLSHDGICGVFAKKYEKDAELNVELEFVLDTKKIKCAGKCKIIWALDMGNDEFFIGLNLLDYSNPNMKDYISYVDNIAKNYQE